MPGTDFGKQILLPAKQLRIPDTGSLIPINRTVEDSGLHEILEHMAAIAELRHESRLTIGHLTDCGEIGDSAEGYGHAELRRGGSHSAGRHQQRFYNKSRGEIQKRGDKVSPNR